MMICKHCHAVFSEPSTYYDRSTGARDEDCPECGSEDIEPAEICPACREWRAADSGFAHSHCCVECENRLSAELSDALNAYLAFLSKDDLKAVEEIVEGKDMIEFWRESHGQADTMRKD